MWIAAMADKRLKDLDLNFDLDSNDEDNFENNILRKNFLKGLSEISGKHIKSDLRKETSNSAVKSHSLDKVSLHDLIPKNTKNADLVCIKENFLNEDIIEKPMHKFEHEKLKRQIGYDQAVKDASEWEPVVYENRKAVQLKFPLAQADIVTITKTKELDKDMKPNTKLEQEVAKVLKESGKILSRHEERTLLSHLDDISLSGISMKGAQEMRAECLKQKALVSYHAAKMKRQNKIKSKKYHRAQKRAKHRQEAQKLEVMKDKNPQAYEEWMLKEEKKRIEERMTLKHKGTSKQMKKNMSYGKFNLEAREAVSEMMKKGKELTRKLGVSSCSEDSECDDISEEGIYQGGINQSLQGKKEMDYESEEDVKTNKQSIKAKKPKLELDVLNSTPFESFDQDLELDNKDILAEFKDEKAAVEDREKVKDVNTFMEGWGSWSGKGIKVSRKKIKRFTIKAPTAQSRRDSALKHLIISEQKDDGIAKHQVDALPKKFTNVPKFQESIAKPLGRQWNKEDKFKQMIRPKVLVKAGSIIDSINKFESLKSSADSKVQMNKARC